VASLGTAVPEAVIERAVEVAGEIRGGDDRPQTVMHVVSIARVWGTALGLPHPGLRPNRVELEEQHRIVHEALRALERRGFAGKTRIYVTRNPAKVIGRFAESIGATAIVVGDPIGPSPSPLRLVRWNPVRDLAKRAGIPVHAVRIDAELPRPLPRRAERQVRRRTGGERSP
jgi:hypothetical protein